MPRYTPDVGRLNFSVSQTGREYQLRLLQRSQSIFTTLLGLLPSNYTSTIVGPNFTLELKCVSVTLARIELALEDVDRDRDYSKTRGDFLYSMVGYLMLTHGRLPAKEFSDTEFRDFLVALVAIYFQGSVPKSVRDITQLLLNGTVLVTENFLLIQQGGSGLDISDQFGFGVDVLIPPGEGFPQDAMAIEATIRLLLGIIRPAHTLFRLRYIFQDSYLPNGTAEKVLDTMSWAMHSYYYDDLRSYWSGIHDRDRLGRKTNQAVLAESHSDDF